MGKYRENWSQLHANAKPSRIVSIWLGIAEFLAWPFVLLRISPHLVSLAGLALSILAWWLSPQWIAAVLIVVSLIFDGLDGAVAVMRDRVTVWGGILDSTLDRIGEAFWAAALLSLGLDARIALTAWVLALIQEYARARVLSLNSGLSITASIAERPVRALFIAAAIVVEPHEIFALAWLGLQAIGLAQVWSFNRRLLR